MIKMAPQGAPDGPEWDPIMPKWSHQAPQMATPRSQKEPAAEGVALNIIGHHWLLGKQWDHNEWLDIINLRPLSPDLILHLECVSHSSPIRWIFKRMSQRVQTYWLPKNWQSAGNRYVGCGVSCRLVAFIFHCFCCCCCLSSVHFVGLVPTSIPYQNIFS